MWSRLPGWVKFLIILLVLAWLGLIPTVIHGLISLADSTRTIVHQQVIPAVHGKGG